MRAPKASRKRVGNLFSKIPDLLISFVILLAAQPPSAVDRGHVKPESRPDASAIYGAIDMPWAKLVGQIAQAYGKYGIRRGGRVRSRSTVCAS